MKIIETLYGGEKTSFVPVPSWEPINGSYPGLLSKDGTPVIGFVRDYGSSTNLKTFIDGTEIELAIYFSHTRQIGIGEELYSHEELAVSLGSHSQLIGQFSHEEDGNVELKNVQAVYLVEDTLSINRLDVNGVVRDVYFLKNGEERYELMDEATIYEEAEVALNLFEQEAQTSNNVKVISDGDDTMVVVDGIVILRLNTKTRTVQINKLYRDDAFLNFYTSQGNLVSLPYSGKIIEQPA